MYARQISQRYYNSPMRALVIILAILIIFAYIRHSMLYNDFYEILQTSPSGLTWELLREKNPIVVTANQPLDEAFRYLYIRKHAVPVTDTAVVQHNPARFCVIRPTGASCRVEIINPKYKNDENYQSVEVLLGTDKSLVLPQHWMYKNDSPVLTESYDSILSLIGKYL